MKINVRKISELTGFSPATVSNALNYKKGVNKETADKIRAVAAELGYNSKAKIRKVRFVIFRRNGLIIDGSTFHPAVIEGVERQAKAFGFETLFNYIDVNQEDYNDSVKEIVEDKESAIVLLGTEMTEEDFIPYLPARERIVLLDGWSDEYFFDSVLISNSDSAYKAVRYLIDKGHTNIGYLRGDFRIQAFTYREEGFKKALERHNLVCRTENMVTVGTKIETAYEGMKKYLESSPEVPTAFFADNDVIAIGCMRALKEFGYSVPKDVSIIGFDNITYTTVSDPPLTTVHVYKQEMGEAAVRALLEKMEGKKTVSTKIQVCTDFIERDSVRELK